MRIADFSLGGGYFYYIGIEPNQTHYQMDGLTPWDYYVVAYSDYGYAAGYTQFVIDGLHIDYDDHTLLTVSVHAGKVTQKIDLADWYAPQGAFPDRP